MHFWPVDLRNLIFMQYTVAGYALLKLQAYTIVPAPILVRG